MTSIPGFEALIAGQRRALAKAITLIESKLPVHREEARTLLDAVLPHTGNSIRIGISGVPGVGKSTFIESLGCRLIQKGHRVAVLAVDPSSPLTGGSILGDKTRMEQLSQSDQAFIRPSPSSGSLGGVAEKTRETMLLCEAAGHDVVLVETVGVGQSEFEVAAMVDFFLVLMLPNAGDELQGIKKGILELADAIIINKADGPYATAAAVAARSYENALHLMHHGDHWKTRVMTCSAQEHMGMEDIWTMIGEYRVQACDSGRFSARRRDQSRAWMWKLVDELIRRKLENDPEARAVASDMEKKVTTDRTTPFTAAHAIVASLIP
jgi:LAO/AO transport system kinase